LVGYDFDRFPSRGFEHVGFFVDAFQYFFHRPVTDDFSFVDDRHPVAEEFGFFEVVGGEHDGRAARVQFPKKVPHAAAEFDIHPGGRFVQYEDFGFVDERAGDHEPPFHSPGKRAGLFVPLVPKQELFQSAFGFGHRFGPGNSIVSGLVYNDFENRFEDSEIEFLRDDPDFRFALGGMGFDIVSKNPNRPARQIDDAGNDSDGGRLPRPIGSEEGVKTAPWNIEVNSFEGAETVGVGFFKSANLERVFFWSGRHGLQG
jgi:hypothetical protein